MFSAMNVLFIKWSGRIADSNATLSKSVALDIATYGRPLANTGKTCIGKLSELIGILTANC